MCVCAMASIPSLPSSERMMQKALTETGPRERVSCVSRMAVIAVAYFFIGLVLALPESFQTVFLVRTMEASDVQMMYAAIYAPWMMKPFVAYVIDHCGKPKSFFPVVTAPMCVVLWAVCAMSPDDGWVFFALIGTSLLTSIADVALDGIMVRRANDPFFQTAEDGAVLSNMQIHARTQMWRALGMALGAYAGGVVTSHYGERLTKIAMCSVYLAFTACVCLITEEAPAETNSRDNQRRQQPSIKAWFQRNVPNRAQVWVLFATVGSPLSWPSRCVRRSREKLRSPITKLMLFTFFLHAIPDYGGLLDAFMVHTLKFDALLIGILDMFGFLGLLIGSIAYTKILPDSPDEMAKTKASCCASSPRSIIMVMMFFVAVEAAVVPIGLLHGWYMRIHVSAGIWACIGGFMRSSTDKMLLNPIQGSIVPFCTALDATTLYAKFTAIANTGSILSMVFGAQLGNWMGVRKDDMSSLWELFVVKSCLYALMIPFARAVPGPAEHAVAMARVEFVIDPNRDLETETDSSEPGDDVLGAK